MLLTSNGLIGPGTPWMYALLPVQQVSWLRDSQGDMIPYWGYDDEESAMFHRTLWLAPPGDGDYWLLDPGDVGPDGEWTAYSWACSSGGELEPSRGFGAMMVAELASMVQVLGK